MNKLFFLLNFFTKENKKSFSKNLANQNNLVGKLLQLLIRSGNCSDSDLMSTLAISQNTLNKICTQAKDILLNELGKSVETPIDRIYVIQKIIFFGEFDFALKLIKETEKEMEEKQLWLNLEYLHIEASRVFYAQGNFAASLKLAEKRKLNSARLAQYINLNSRILNEMIRIEGFRIRKTDLKAYQKKIAWLKKEAFALQHHVLIHNALHLNYVFANRYSQNTKSVYDIILAMQANMKQFDAVMHPFSKAIINNTYLNFLTIYNGFGNPEVVVQKVKKEIYAAGKVAAANMCYAMLEYFLYEMNIPKVMDWLAELESIEDNSKFRQYKHIIIAIMGFIEKDVKLFKANFSEFYNDPSHLDFPDMEVNLRIMELLLLLKRNDDRLMEAKSIALKKYISRNVNADRYSEERKIVLLIEKGMFEKKEKIIPKLKEFAKSEYRNIVFLVKQMVDILE